MHLTIDGCPRPLSRKKLRQLMPQNKSLTANSLAARYGRRPGAGRFKTCLLLEEMNLKRQDNGATAEHLRGKVKEQLLRIGRLLVPARTVQRTTRAARAI